MRVMTSVELILFSILTEEKEEEKESISLIRPDQFSLFGTARGQSRYVQMID